MSERLPLPAELFRSPHPGPAGVDAQVNGVVHRLMDLADRGDYLSAAEQAAELLRADACDVRLVAIYLMGSFVERGITALPDLLGCVDRLLGEGGDAQDAEGSTRAPSRHVDSAMSWLFRALADRVAFHTTRRDETWNAWLVEVTPEQIQEMATRCETISAKSPGAAGTLHKVARWARDKLGPAAARVTKPEPAPSPAPSDASTIDPAPVDPRPGWDEADDFAADELEHSDLDDSDDLDVDHH